MTYRMFIANAMMALMCLTELHIYANTSHDFAVRPGDGPFATWPNACHLWLQQQRFLPTAHAK